MPALAQPRTQTNINLKPIGNLDLRVDHFQPLTPTTAEHFFGSLYAQPPVGQGDNFNAIANRVVTRLGSVFAQGDQALQTLLSNYVLQNPTNRVRDAKLSAALAGIKQRAVQEFTNVYPNVNLETLILEAQKAGYDVEILNVK